ncbi:MAG TPA: carboxymuconolactone decarboxylase family protein, partial [Cytophagales bacterium]|nr:carboxymuconolactone decarboxylase family protein [Cytophagales bacterium]
MIKERIRIKDLEPDAFTAMYGLVKYLDHSQLNPAHKKLMMIRASQINGCAYCIDMHTIEARRAGETEQRIYALSAWRDTPFFSEQERALLALTE